MGNPASSQFGPFLIDVGERTLRRDGEPVPLTPKAFDVLVALLEKPGQLISKDELLQKVWPDTFVEESNLAYNIFALRKALGDTAENSRYIETVPKKGYRFRASVSPASPPRDAQPASEFGAEPGRTPFTGDTRDGEVTILPFRKGPAQSQVALERKAEPYSPAVEPPAVPDSDPPRRFSFRRPWVWFAAAAVLVAAGLSRRPIAVGFARGHAATCGPPDVSAGSRSVPLVIPGWHLRRVQLERPQEGQPGPVRPADRRHGSSLPPADQRPSQRLQPELVA